MPPEDARSHLARQWVTKADHDLRTANLAMRAQDGLWDIACPHSQQAAEKALKAFLAWHDVAFLHTHNLVALLEQCEEIDEHFASLRSHAAFLTGFAVAPRYPDMIPEPDQPVAQNALERASDVVLFVLEHLPGELGP